VAHGATEPSKRICVVCGAGHVRQPSTSVLTGEDFTVDMVDIKAQQR